MTVSKNLPNQPAFRWISISAVLLFILYWIFSLCTLFFPKTVNRALPKTRSIYHAFMKQDWKLFAYTQPYYREMMVIVRDDNHPGATDTIRLINDILAMKRASAPLINKADAIDRMMFYDANRLEALLYSDSNNKNEYRCQGSPSCFDSLIATNAAARQSLNNFERYALTVAGRLKIPLTNRSFQLMMIHEPTPVPGGKPAPGRTFKIIFSTSYKKW